MRLPFLLLAVSGFSAAAVVSQEQLHLFSGASAGAEFGAAAAVVRDVDGDGRADVAIGAPRDATGGVDAGLVRVYSSASGAVLHTFVGAAGDLLGSAVANAGDVDGDGRGDVVLGAPGSGSGAGAVHVRSGRTGAVLWSFAGNAGDGLGTAVAGGADLEPDGWADVVAGAPGASSGAGAVRAWSGRTGTLLWSAPGDSAGDALGTAVAATVAEHGDGVAAVAAGAPGDDDAGSDGGAVRLYDGATGAVQWTVFGAAAGDALGTALAGCDDADGDGRGDVVAGAPLADAAGADAGVALVLSGIGGATVQTLAGDAAGDRFGSAVAGLGDADGDGAGDVLVGAPGSARGGAGSGRARAFSGATGAPLFDRIGAAGDALGTAVGGIGDADRDGFGDAALGAPGADTGVAGGGAVSLLASRPYDEHRERVTLGPGQAKSQSGFMVRGLPDFSGDGVPDYAVGAPFDMNRFGAVYVYSGADDSLLQTLTGLRIDTWFGHSIASAGDIDADGVPDLLVGAWHDDSSGLTDNGSVTVFSGRTWTRLREIFGTSNLSHMGSSIGTLGDLDGDGHDDFFTGLGEANNLTGALWVWSGKTFTVMYRINGQTGVKESFAWSAAPIGDVDGDGFCDFAVGVPQNLITPIPGPGEVRVHSGIDGTFLWKHTGIQRMSLFGWSVGPAGDTDGDGVPDVVAGGYRLGINELADVGHVRLLSGADGSLLHEWFGSAADDRFGIHVWGGLDANGDGFGDVVVGAAAASPPGGLPKAGEAWLFSGFDGRSLDYFPGESLLGATGSSVGMVGDVDGNGLAEVLVGTPQPDPNGQFTGYAEVYTGVPRTFPGALFRYGAACPTATGVLPELRTVGRPVRGRTFSVVLRGAAPGAGAALLLGLQADNTPLGAAGMPGCTSLVMPLITVNTVAGAGGTTQVPLPVPDNRSVPGIGLFVQWALVSMGANPIHVVATGGGEVVLGRP